MVYRKREKSVCWSQPSRMLSLPRTAAAVTVYALVALIAGAGAAAAGGGEQPLSRIAIHRATVAPQPGAFVDASPALLGREVSPLKRWRLRLIRVIAGRISSWARGALSSSEDACTVV